MLDASLRETDTAKARERECVHRRANVDGQFYAGDAYVKSLLRLRATAATQMSKNVTPFFWADAPRVNVWLCDSCARQLSLV